LAENSAFNTQISILNTPKSSAAQLHWTSLWCSPYPLVREGERKK